MPLVLSEEQLMLKNSATEFCKSTPVETLRKLRDEKHPKGFDSKVWKDMVEMGWTSLNIPESYGGLNFGYTGLGQVLEETGKTLTASPLFSTVFLGSTILLLAGTEAQKESLLPSIVAGENTFT